MNQEKILKLEKEIEKMFDEMTPQEAREENWHFFFAPSLREYVIQTDPSFKEIYQATDKALPKIKASIFAEILKSLCFKSIEFLFEKIFNPFAMHYVFFIHPVTYCIKFPHFFVTDPSP